MKQKLNLYNFYKIILIFHETNLFITPGGIFGSGGDQYLRISLCSPVTDFEEALERIHLSELKV